MARSVLTQLRDLVPLRPLTQGEAMRVAELQANRLLELMNIGEGPTPEGVISGQPHVRVERMAPIPVSGSAHWVRPHWIIVVNGAEPPVRQRFSLAHEYKHILDHGRSEYLYPRTSLRSHEERVETACDYFAGCLLMPRQWLKRDWGNGIQDLRTLSRRYGVSQMAMRVRLLQIGLVEPARRCQTYYRHQNVA